MALILNIDTSTEVCSVALAKDGQVIALRECGEGQNHSTLLGVYVDELLKEKHLHVMDLDAAAVSMGPGSYTGLRIGVSLAKGLCFGGGIPLIAVSTLQALATRVILETNEPALYCPMIDARRMEVYTALYDSSGNTICPVSAKIIEANSFEEWLNQGKVYFFGNGSTKVQFVIRHPNAIFVEEIKTSAVNMVPLAEEKWQQREFEDIAYFEPYYLKDFVATTPKRKVL